MPLLVAHALADAGRGDVPGAGAAAQTYYGVTSGAAIVVSSRDPISAAVSLRMRSERSAT